MIIIIMGVSGAGKVDVGRLLATQLGKKFFDANDYRTQELKDKIESGTPLSDSDHLPWLKTLNQLLADNKSSGVVLAFSALKESYRYTVTHKHGNIVKWVYLGSDIENLLSPAENSSETNTRDDQMNSLEEPTYGIHLPASLPTEENVAEIIKVLDLN